MFYVKLNKNLYEFESEFENNSLIFKGRPIIKERERGNNGRIM